MNDKTKHPLKVFLCHASGDKPSVRELYKRLNAEGVDTWLDQEKLLPGQNWRVEIPRAVREADVVVICLSKKSITKEGYVQKEIKFALDIAEEKPEGAIFLIPARLEECVVPERLSLWQWVDLYEENGFGKLLRSLKLRADAVGATIEPASYVDSDKELDQRIKQLYMEGLAAFYTEDWDKACQRFQSILREQPNHKNATEKLAEAERQRNLSKLYGQATAAVRSEDWGSAIKILEELSQKSASYRDVAQLLRNAEKQKQLKELYAEAETLHAGQKWQAVVRVFEQILAIQPDYPDPNGLLASAQKEVVELKRINELNELYSDAISEMDTGRWHEARTLLEKIHKSQTGFLETERLLRKAENEIKKTEDQNRRTEQVNVLYEQAHGLIRTKSWRKALDKIEEIQQLDSQFGDKDGITEQAKAELAREEQEVQRQNELAALYAESVRLMQEGKYQEALDKWDEVRAIDPKYPDRQWVQRTAKKKLAEMTKPVKVKPRFVMTKLHWTGIVTVIAITGVIAGVIFSGMGNQGVSPSPTKLLDSTDMSGKADPTMYDDFGNTSYDGVDNGSYNHSLWNSYTRSSDYSIWQYGGDLSVKLFDQAEAGLEANDFLYIDKPAFVEIRMYLDPSTTDNDSHFYSYFYIQDHGGINCGIFGHKNDTQDIKCWSEFYGKEVEANLGLDGIPPAWHVFRLEIEPETMTISYVIDDRKLGVFVPSDSIPEYFDEFRQSNFRFKFGINNIGPSKAPQGRVDYVRMGAIEDDPVVYDDFDGPSHLGSYNSSIWSVDTSSSHNTASQAKDGTLTLANFGPENYIDLMSRKYTEKALTSPTYIKSYFMKPSEQNGGVGIVVRINEIGAFVACYIGGDDPGQTLDCEAVNFGEYKEVVNMPIEPGSWHKAYIEVDPNGPTFTFHIDSSDLVSYSPPQPERYQSARYNFFITSFCSGSGCTLGESDMVEGVFDYVEIGIP